MKKRKPISLILCIFSLTLFSSYHVYNICISELNNKKVDKIIENEMKEKSDSKLIANKINYKDKKDYLGIISIPKINLKKEFYHINDKRNNVDKNVTLLKDSVMPNIKGGTLYLAAHSGNSYLGYFKDLNKLVINDIVYIYYNNIEYKYVVSDKYELDKNGKIIIINKNINENYLVLTTCSKTKNKQLLVIGKLIK